MSYTKYKTEGIILGGSNTGEADRSYNIFTKDFGLLRVKAQGIRELKAKLKYHLQNLYLTELHLINGKGGWRIVEAYKIKGFSDVFSGDKVKLQSSTRILLFLKRMLSDEDSNDELFDIIIKGLELMELDNNLDKKDILNLESLIILRVLRNLGYIKDNHKFEELLSDNVYNKEVLNMVDESRILIVKEINQSIKASEL